MCSLNDKGTDRADQTERQRVFSAEDIRGRQKTNGEEAAIYISLKNVDFIFIKTAKGP
jgi:hypothetical protein